VKRLEKMGFRVIKNLKQVKVGSIFIIRSHGISPQIINELKKKKVKIVDATCPFVKKAQLTAEKFFKDGRKVIIFGDPSHAEVIGINGHTKNSAIVVKNLTEARRLKKMKKAGILSQTTLQTEMFNKVALALAARSRDALIISTICRDSSIKKTEVKELAKKMNVMVIVGGKESNNTRKLVQVSRSAGTKTYHIETAEELKPAWFKKARKIGLAAGASTPDWIIEEVAEKTKQF
jgi:4-hydroxy-3-methylbut-2-enyl diphosphate reductase